ncbi:hypothetical protein KP509_06G031800 [Ceratopteris richardii]|uniref:Uncharacterized protein n=1 Tax=Ceratopteris richardii TaxID=49495 RepID=A0A8T2UMW6_CERRI|nr:hypothetical protein KP509_06G031800 [Ceratopteris richardii]
MNPFHMDTELCSNLVCMHQERVEGQQLFVENYDCSILEGFDINACGVELFQGECNANIYLQLVTTSATLRVLTSVLWVMSSLRRLEG